MRVEGEYRFQRTACREGAVRRTRGIVVAITVSIAALGAVSCGSQTTDSTASEESGQGAPADDARAPESRSAEEEQIELANTHLTPRELAEDFLVALRDRDDDALIALALSEEEFRAVVWPELPSSRPERNVPFEYAWGDLNQKSRNELRRTLARYGGEEMEFVRIEFDDETTDYAGVFKVHRDARLVLVDEHGHMSRLDLFGSVIEKGGRYKIFSFVTD